VSQRFSASLSSLNNSTTTAKSSTPQKTAATSDVGKMLEDVFGNEFKASDLNA